jgi:hypothetical protein
MSRIRANTITNQNANGAPNFPDGLTVTGIVTATVSSSTLGSLSVTGNATVGGNLSIGGTLTYEDVTNVDSIGIITARSSINVNAASSGIGVTINSGGINVAGIVTATSYRGDGSQLSGISVDPSAAASSSGFLKVLNASTPQIRLNNDASDGATTRAFFGIASGSNNFVNGSTANDTVLTARAAGDLLIGCGSTVRMRISENGHVTKPNTPMFQARHSTNGAITINQGVIPFGTVINNVGSHYNNSNYRFTAPVAGIYLFYVGWFVISHSTHRVSLRVNGGDFSTPYINGFNTGQISGVVNPAGSHFLSLSANDYVDCYTDGAFTPYGTHLGWGGCLLH